MTKPLTKWDDEGHMPDNLVWRSKVDNHYLVEIQRTGDYTAKLCIFDNNDENSIIHEEDVSLSYAAQFGPDISDVALWQDACIDVIDHPEKRSSNA